MNNYHKSQEERMKELTRQKGQEAIPTGKVHTKEYRSYYDIDNTITTALATNPSNPDHPSYNVEPVFQHSQRNAEKIYVSNDGSDTLFVLVSHGGVEHSTRERPVYPGDVKVYYNVFELRLRSPTAGVPYRVSEYKIDKCCSSSAPIQGISIIPLQSLTAAPRVITSSTSPDMNPLDVTDVNSASIFIHLGRTNTNAFTAGVNFRIEASATSSGDGQWYPVTTFTSALGTNIGSQAVNGTAAAGQKVVPIAATANFVVGDIVYIQNATRSQGEFGRITTVTLNTSITLEDNLVFAQPATSTVTSKSEMYYALIDTSSIGRLRVVVDGSGAGQNFDVEVKAVSGS